MEHKLRNKESFMKTRAFDKSLDCLTMNGVLVIIGNAGDGKTTLAINILDRLKQQGYIVLVFSDPKLLEESIDPDRQIVYFVDDAFGTPTLNKRLVEIWTRLHDKIDSLVSKRKMSLVLTSRKIVLLKGKHILSGCHRYADALVDITDNNMCLTEVERRMLVAKHCQGHGLFPTVLMNKLQGYTPGFPLLCRLYATNERLRKIEYFFEKPLLILQKDISGLLDHDIAAFCAMVLIVLYDGKLPVEYLDVFEEDGIDEVKIDTVVKAYCLDKNTALSKMADAMNAIIGVYVEEVDDSYVFLHDSIFDAVCLIFGKRHPREVLRIASSEFIEQRIRTKDSISTDTNDAIDVIILKKNHFNVLSKRWISDILNGHIKSVINNPSIQDLSMLAIFIDNIEQLPASTFVDFIGMSEGQMSVIEFAFDEGYSDLASHLLKKIKMTTDLLEYEIPQKCLQKSIERKDVTLVNMLLNHGVSTTDCIRPFKTTSIHFAARVGDVEILRMLIDHNKCKSISSKDFFGMQPIHYACQKSNTACVELLLKHGCDLDCEDADGKRPIQYACYTGSEGCVEVLHSAGADLNKKEWRGRTPLHFAAMCENCEVVCYLLKHGCDVNVLDVDLCTPLFYACRNGRWKNIKALIHGGADTNIHDANMKFPIHAAAEGCHSDDGAANACIKLLLGVNTNVNEVDDQGKTALHYACAWSFDHRYDSVQLLIDLEADVNIQDGFKMQPLMYACNSGSFQCAGLLLQYGANPNIEGPRQNKPIHLASADGSVDIVKLLMSKGVDIKAKNDDGRQPIHFSSQYGNDDVICLLSWNGADVNAKDNSGKGPLHYACKWGRTKTVKLLMKLGADPHAKDNDGTSPKDLIPRWATNSQVIRQCLSSSSNSL